jgi:2-alkenal reductase
VQLDPDAVVAAFEEVIGRVHDDVLPSVVQIRVTQKIITDDETPDFGFPSPFENSPLPSPDEPDFFFREGEGSGFVWSDEGYIVTNQHVVANADTLTITFANGTEVEGVVVGEDPDSDLAVLKVDLPKDMLPPVALGDSNDVRVGQIAVAIGNPFGQNFTTTTGIVSAIGRTIRSGNTRFSVPKVIQTDAPINPGNSGGPLLNRKGQVIGINTQIISRTGASTGIGFAVPINTAKQVIPVLIEDGKFIYAWLGISGTDLRKEVAEAMNIDAEIRGAQVIDLAPDGPAEKGGLRGSDRTQEVDRGLIPVGGDVIVAIDDLAIADMDDLIIYLIENARPGDTIILDVVRDGGESAEVEVTLGSRPE